MLSEWMLLKQIPWLKTQNLCVKKFRIMELWIIHFFGRLLYLSTPGNLCHLVYRNCLRSWQYNCTWMLINWLEIYKQTCKIQTQWCQALILDSPTEVPFSDLSKMYITAIVIARFLFGSVLSGYTGVLCQTDIDECASNPCQNGGVCDESVLNTYGCLCRSGFTGVDCETDIDDCEVNTCKNYQICVDLIDGHR